MFYCSLQWLVDVRLIGMRLTILLILLISGDFSDAGKYMVSVVKD